MLPCLRWDFDLRGGRRDEFRRRWLDVLSHNESSAPQSQDTMNDQTANQRSACPLALSCRGGLDGAYGKVSTHGLLALLLFIAVQRHAFDARLSADIEHIHDALMRGLIRSIQRHQGEAAVVIRRFAKTTQ